MLIKQVYLKGCIAQNFCYYEFESFRELFFIGCIEIFSGTIMKLYEENKIDINGFLSDYILMLRGTDKDSLNFMEVLAHTAGLQNWIPFYESTITDEGWNDSIYSSQINEDYPTRVAENMYLRKGYETVLFDSIIESPFQDKSYHYSGLGFYLFKKMVEDIENDQFDEYVYDEFYDLLGLKYLRYNPRKYFSLLNIIPTENDTVFRKQQLIGDVHDQGAALMGGVSGNAGLFGNSYNVAVFMQMLLNGGSYGDVHLFEPSTVDFFTEYHFAADSNRRGLGFDKPLLEYEDHMTNCKDASPSSFGHSGFTGTYAWADPETGLVYVFLSNRVYPDMSNSKLMKWDVRTNIHQLFYESLKIK
jgi:CubicO group peptidase (beta-lactamase class C family)